LRTHLQTAVALMVFVEKKRDVQCKRQGICCALVCRIGSACVTIALQENDNVLVVGCGRKGHAVGDIPGVRFKIVKVRFWRRLIGTGREHVVHRVVQGQEGALAFLRQ
jgi:SSU ribosomal protein S12P